ncbi:MAG: hypothetical protein D6694_09165 [Gammaproteobacteria bacterium]|nr:MAG: hypothetical protein D6694_09165 [Gammaproteobacteria bacterium]
MSAIAYTTAQQAKKRTGGASLQAPTSELTVFVDLGSSCTKTFYAIGENAHFAFLPPEIAIVSQNRLSEFFAANETAAPIDTLWLELGDGEPITVGRLAETFRGDSLIARRKVDPGLFRILGTIGGIRDTFSLPSPLTVNLGIALPAAEYADRKILQEKLAGVTKLICRGRELQITWGSIDCQLEGAGLIRERRARLQNVGAPSKIVSLMLGHRNASLLIYEGSSIQVEKCRSDGPGFFVATDLAARLLGQEPSTPGLTEAIAAQSQSLRIQGRGFKPIDISSAVAEARTGYWQQVRSFLESYLPAGQFDLVCGGGAAWAMRSELRELAAEIGIKVSFAEELQQQLRDILSFHGGSEDELGENLKLLQMADAFIGFQALVAKQRRRQQRVSE